MQYNYNPDCFRRCPFRDETLRSPKELRIKARPLAAIDAIVLHQTGVERTNENAGLLRVNSHWVVLPNGGIYLLHPPESYLYSANSFNRRSISIEISGNFEGDIGKGNWYKPEKFGRGEVSNAAINATRQLLGWIKHFSGLNIRYIFAHRQSGKSAITGKPNRPLDPGERIWRDCGIWAQNILQLSDGGNGYVSGGLPIPANWKRAPLTPWWGEGDEC